MGAGRRNKPIARSLFEQLEHVSVDPLRKTGFDERLPDQSLRLKRLVAGDVNYRCNALGLFSQRDKSSTPLRAAAVSVSAGSNLGRF